ncbi:MAG: hypothetical protein HZA24_01975 [Nitrospirae bacterium]|nr:hypothetical protein [Nitrospirota bacterium]
MKSFSRNMILAAAIALAAAGPAFAADTAHDEHLILPQVDIAIEIVKDDDDVAGSVDVLTDPQGSDEVHVELPHIDGDMGHQGAGAVFRAAAKEPVADGSGGTPPVGPSSVVGDTPSQGGSPDASLDDSPDGEADDDHQGAGDDSADDSDDDSMDDSDNDSQDDSVGDDMDDQSGDIEDSVDDIGDSIDDIDDGMDDSMDDVEDGLGDDAHDAADGGDADAGAGADDLH